MECPKCHGTVVREWVPQAVEEEECQLRCLNCGWLAPIEDPKQRRSQGLDALVSECSCDDGKKGPAEPL